MSRQPSEEHRHARTWRLRDAKNRFDEVVERALAEGAQTVTRRGRAAVVVVSMAEWRRLTRPRRSFKSFLMTAPLTGVDLGRAKDFDREIDLP